MQYMDRQFRMVQFAADCAEYGISVIRSPVQLYAHAMQFAMTVRRSFRRRSDWIVYGTRADGDRIMMDGAVCRRLACVETCGIQSDTVQLPDRIGSCGYAINQQLQTRYGYAVISVYS